MVSGFSLFRKHLTIALWSLSGHLFMPIAFSSSILILLFSSDRFSDRLQVCCRIIQKERHLCFLPFYLKCLLLFTSSLHSLMFIKSIVTACICEQEEFFNAVRSHIIQHFTIQHLSDAFSPHRRRYRKNATSLDIVSVPLPAAPYQCR